MKGLKQLRETLSSVYKVEDLTKRQYGLALNEIICLDILNEGPNSPGVIAGEMSVSLSRMSRILAVLEEKDLVTREISSEDKRKMIFSLSTKGQKKVKDIGDLKLDSAN